MATINKIDLNGDTYDIESSWLVTTQPTNPSEWATYYDTVNDVVKVYDGTSWNPISWWGGSVAYATSSTAWNVAEKVVSIPSITTLDVWQIICVHPTASATVANLTIKLNNFPAYPIRYNNWAITTTTDDLVWSQNFVSQFVFDGTYRQFVSHGYDNNTTYTQNILFDRGGFVSGSGTYAITRYSICLQKPDMTWEKVTNTWEDYSVNNNKTVNTHWFLLNGEMLYYSNTSVLANGAISSSNTMYKQYSGFDIRYSANTSGTGYTAGDYIYFVGTIGVDGLFYLDATQWWTNTLPSTNDGKIYVKVGKYVSGVTVTLELEHPAYYHDGTRIREYKWISSRDVTTALWYTPADSSTLWTAATKNTWTSSWNVPVLDSNWHLANSTIPWVALTDTFTVSTSSDLTTLSNADQWDLAIVSSENKTYVLSQAPYSTASNWKQILSPTGWVTSVNGQTWAVTLNADNISDTSTTNKFVTQTDKDAWDWKQDELQSWVNIRTINWTSILWSWDITTPVWWDVYWPSSATNWHLAVFDWTTGKLIKDWWAVPTWFNPWWTATTGYVVTKTASGYEWQAPTEPTVVSGDSGVIYTIKVSNSDPASWTASNIITFVL